MNETPKDLGKDILVRNKGEIGMHLHAWDTPPFYKLTVNDYQYQPYLIEYPENIMREKVKIMTDLLEDLFNTKMISHRSGRWSFNETYSNILIDFGYKVDCSVTPFVSWQNDVGDPTQSGGTNYSYFPTEVYFLDPLNISKPGNSDLLEIPVTIKCKNYTFNKFRIKYGKNLFLKRTLNFISPLIWLRPNLRNSTHLVKLLKESIYGGKDYVEFMLHSSELMPAGSPTFPNESSIEKLYDILEELFELASSEFVGCTLSEYYKIFCEREVFEKKDQK